MSAASAIGSIYQALNSNSSSFSIQAQALVAEAQTIINNGGTFTPAPIIFTPPTRTEPEVVKVPIPPVIKTKHYVIPPIPPLKELIPVSNSSDAVKPLVNFPGKVFDPLLIETDYTPIVFDGSLTPPEFAPDFSLIGENQEPRDPTLTKPKEFYAEPLDDTPDNIGRPQFDSFNEEVIAYYQEAIGLFGKEIAPIHQWFVKYSGEVGGITSSLISRLNEVINQSFYSSPPEEWHTITYQQSDQVIQFEKQQGVAEFDRSTSAITGLPTGARFQERLKIAHQVTQKQIESLGKTDQGLREKEFNFLKFALANAQQLTNLAIALKTQQVAWTQQAMSLAIDGFDATIESAMTAIELKEKEINATIGYNEFQIKRSSAMIDVEKTKIEALKINLESEKLKLDYNQNNVNAYQVAIDLVSQRIKKTVLESEYALSIKNIELLKLDVLKTEVEKYQANVSLFKLKQDLMNSKTKEDKLFFDAALEDYLSVGIENRKKNVYLKQELNHEKIVAQNLLQEAEIYNSKVSGLIKEFEAISKTSDIAVKAVLAGNKAESAMPGIKIKKQQIDDAKKLYEKMIEAKDKKFNASIALKKHLLIIDKLKAQAQTTAQAAGVAGGIATHAFAGLNAVGTDVLEEFA